MGVIRRSMEFLDKENFKFLFTALVRPHLEYANAAWSPSLKKHITALENVQRRATRYIPGLKNMTYEQRLRELKLPTLKYRRYRGDMIETFKITHDLYDKDVTAGFLPMVPQDSITRGHRYTIFKRNFNLNIRKNSFTYRIVDQWNHLPESVVTANTVRSFEHRLDKMWKQSAPEVMYDHEINIREATSARSVRYFATNTIDTNHAPKTQVTSSYDDLMSEA